MVIWYMDNIKEEIHRKPLIWYNKVIYKYLYLMACFIEFSGKTA